MINKLKMVTNEIMQFVCGHIQSPNVVETWPTISKPTLVLWNDTVVREWITSKENTPFLKSFPTKPKYGEKKRKSFSIMICASARQY